MGKVLTVIALLALFGGGIALRYVVHRIMRPTPAPNAAESLARMAEWGPTIAMEFRPPNDHGDTLIGLEGGGIPEGSGIREGDEEMAATGGYFDDDKLPCIQPGEYYNGHRYD